jgi:hypothetical protein
LDSVRLGNHIYHLTGHFHADSYGYYLYECNRLNLLCYDIPFSTLSKVSSSSPPRSFHIDTTSNTLYILDWRGEAIYEYQP